MAEAAKTRWTLVSSTFLSFHRNKIMKKKSETENGKLFLAKCFSAKTIMELRVQGTDKEGKEYNLVVRNFKVVD